MFEKWKTRRALRDTGLNPDDFRDAFTGRGKPVLFTSFRHLRHD